MTSGSAAKAGVAGLAAAQLTESRFHVVRDWRAVLMMEASKVAKGKIAVTIRQNTQNVPVLLGRQAVISLLKARLSASPISPNRLPIIGEIVGRARPKPGKQALAATR